MKNRKPKSITKTSAQLRSRLILKGISMRGWAQERGYPLSTVYSAVHGRRGGAKSRRIINELTKISE